MCFVLLFDSKLIATDKCTGRWYCGRTPKDELPDPRGSLVNDIATFSCHRASQSTGSTRQPPFTTCVKSGAPLN